MTDLDDILHPRRYALERLPVGNVVHQHEPFCALEKARRERVKPLLSCCVPDLKRNIVIEDRVPAPPQRRQPAAISPAARINKKMEPPTPYRKKAAQQREGRTGGEKQKGACSKLSLAGLSHYMRRLIKRIRKHIPKGYCGVGRAGKEHQCCCCACQLRGFNSGSHVLPCMKKNRQISPSVPPLLGRHGANIPITAGF